MGSAECLVQGRNINSHNPLVLLTFTLFTNQPKIKHPPQPSAANNNNNSDDDDDDDDDANIDY
jgi:hypothetical protein